MNYYFLVASLPDISMETAPSFSMDDFLSSCETSLDASDMAVLTDLMERSDIPGYHPDNSAFDPNAPEAPPAQHPFTRALQVRESELRDILVLSRAAATGVDASPHRTEHPGWRSGERKTLEDVLAKNNPLDLERTLDSVRWSFIDETAGLDAFSAESVFAYGLKLRLVERWASMDTEAGSTKLNDIVAALGGSATEEDDTNNTTTNQHKAE